MLWASCLEHGAQDYSHECARDAGPGEAARRAMLEHGRRQAAELESHKCGQFATLQRKAPCAQKPPAREPCGRSPYADIVTDLACIGLAERRP